MKIEKGATLERTFRITRAEGPDGMVRYQASISSEQVARQWFGREMLVHSEESIDLDRAQDGSIFPLLYDHDQQIGKVENLRLDGQRLRGDFVFSRHSQLAKEVQGDVDDGIRGNVSLKYEINDYEIDDPGDGAEPTFRITRWKPLEASIVRIPADSKVGVGRAHNAGEKAMTDKTDTGAGAGNSGAPGSVNVVEFERARQQAIAAGREDGARLERERIAEIDAMFGAQRFQGEGFDALRKELVEKGSTPDQARAALIDYFKTMPVEPSRVEPAARSTVRDPQFGTRDPGWDRATAGEDDLDKFQRGAELALDIRCGLIDSKEARREAATNEFADLSLAEVAREYVRRAGIRMTGMSKRQIVAAALRPDIHGGRRDVFVGHSTSVFASLLENVANKSLLRGYEEIPETWRIWTRVGALQDFKPTSVVNVSAFSDIEEVQENGEYKHGTMRDVKEIIRGKKYGRLFAITREAIINDDLDGLSVAPRAMGRAASRKVGDLVYDVLLNPPNMLQTGNALFHNNHNNQITSGGAPPSVASLDATRLLLALQTDPSGNAVLGIRGKYILVPMGLETRTNILIASEHDPVGDSDAEGGARQPNPFRNAFTVVADHRLEAANSGKGWFLAADQNIYDTIMVGFVGGQENPQLESRDGWTVDGVEYKVRHEFGVAPLDFRALAYNDGD